MDLLAVHRGLAVPTLEREHNSCCDMDRFTGFSARMYADSNNYESKVKQMTKKLLFAGRGMRKLLDVCKARGYTKDNSVVRVAKKGGLDANFRIYEKPATPRYTFYVSKIGSQYKIEKVKTEYGDIVNGSVFPPQLNAQTNLDKFNSELRQYMKTRGTYAVVIKKGGK